MLLEKEVAWKIHSGENRCYFLWSLQGRARSLLFSAALQGKNIEKKNKVEAHKESGGFVFSSLTIEASQRCFNKLFKQRQQNFKTWKCSQKKWAIVSMKRWGKKKKIKHYFHKRKYIKLRGQNAEDEKEMQQEILPNIEHFTDVINSMKYKKHKQTWI